MESNTLEPQHAMPVPVNQVGHALEVTQTQGDWVPARPRAQHQNTRKQIEEDYPLLEDILNPIPFDIILSGKYLDTPVNTDELASVEVLPEFRKQGKQLVGAKDQITPTHGTMPKQQHINKLIRKLATSAVKQYNLLVMLLTWLQCMESPQNFQQFTTTSEKTKLHITAQDVKFKKKQ